MRAIAIGDEVRKYYEDDAFDAGFVQDIRDGWAVVDFYDWIERWPQDKFMIWNVYLEWVEVYLPEGAGEIIQDFRRS